MSPPIRGILNGLAFTLYGVCACLCMTKATAYMVTPLFVIAGAFAVLGLSEGTD